EGAEIGGYPARDPIVGAGISMDKQHLRWVTGQIDIDDIAAGPEKTPFEALFAPIKGRDVQRPEGDSGQRERHIERDRLIRGDNVELDLRCFAHRTNPSF